MIVTTLLCAAILLVSVAALLSERERLRLLGIVALIEHEAEHDRGRDPRAALKAAGLLPLHTEAVEAAFQRRYNGWSPRRQKRTVRGRYIRHVLGLCEGCSWCSWRWLWIEMARQAGRLDKWIEMAREHGDPRVKENG